MKKYRISEGEGYGGRHYIVGETVQAPCYGECFDDGVKYLTILESTKKYFDEEGMSFGVGCESGYVFCAICREATTEEIEQLIKKEQKKRKLKKYQKELYEIKQTIKRLGTYVQTEEQLVLDGEVLFDNQNLYGGGDWIVVQKDFIWYVVNNGQDGDNWSNNNIRTGGAGAIGRCLERTDEMVEQLRELQKFFNEVKNENKAK